MNVDLELKSCLNKKIILRIITLCKKKDVWVNKLQKTLQMFVNMTKVKHCGVGLITGEFMTYQGCEEEANQQEALSTSSLRRKLFFHCESSPATTPVG